MALVRSKGDIALAMATSGIAGTLLPGGSTIHSKLKAPIKLTDTSECAIKERSGLAEMVKKTKLLVFDEVTQGHKDLYETVDRSLKKLKETDKPFGGIPVLLAGDWMQILPVVKRGGKPEILSSTLKNSKLWKHVKSFKLIQNMRLKNSTDPEEIAFNEWLLRVGTGKEKKYPELGNEDLVKIPENLKAKSINLKDFCNEIFPNLGNVVSNGLKNHDVDPEWVDYLVERAILNPKNVDCHEINQICLGLLDDQPMMIYRSTDKIINPTEEINFPTEFLNQVNKKN